MIVSFCRVIADLERSTIITAVSVQTGVLQDIDGIGRLCREHGVPLHLDAVQAFGRLPFRAHELPVDMLTVSGHKVYGPQGVGALWVRTGLSIAPQLTGGHQERGRRAGTENVASIAGFGAACRRIPALIEDQGRIAALRDRLWQALSGLEGAERNGHTEHVLSNTLNVSFSDVEGEAMLMGLDLAGVSVSSGSACTAGSLEPSHVLVAMGVASQRARGAVRFSLGTENTEAQIDTVASHVVDVVQRMRRAA